MVTKSKKVRILLIEVAKSTTLKEKCGVQPLKGRKVS